MTIRPASPAQRVSAVPPAWRSVDVHASDAAKLVDEFAAAARRGTGALPASEMRSPKLTENLAEALADAAAGTAPQTATAQGTAGVVAVVAPTAVPVQPRLHDGGRPDYRLAAVRDDEPGSGILTVDAPATALVAAAVPSPAARSHVDAAHFADMLTQLWSREQAGATQEMRVSFGDKAWPATGARLLRLADGSLQIAVIVGQDRAAIAAQLASLRERLKARGLAVAGITVDDDPDKWVGLA